MCLGQIVRKSFKKSRKVLRRVLKKIRKVRLRLNKIGLKFSRGKKLVTCEKDKVVLLKALEKISRKTSVVVCFLILIRKNTFY